MFALCLCFLPTVTLAQEVVNEGEAHWRITTLRATPGQWRELKMFIETQGAAGSIDSVSGRRIPFRI